MGRNKTPPPLIKNPKVKESERNKMTDKIQAIYFDLDGTIADLYAVDNWAVKLNTFDPSPYEQAKPMVNMSYLARLIHKVQRLGIAVGIVSWLSKNSTTEYDNAVTVAKLEWLRVHLPSVTFDEIKIVAYGTPKSEVVSNAVNGILFDDEEHNRNEWSGLGLEPNEIFNIMRSL